MLAISETTLRTLETSARPLFARRVQLALAEKYQHFLPRFPEPVQAVIVANMLGRAARWSIHGQRALLAFCELMIAVAEGEESAAATEALASGFIALTSDLEIGVDAFKAKQKPAFSRS